MTAAGQITGREGDGGGGGGGVGGLLLARHAEEDNDHDFRKLTACSTTTYSAKDFPVLLMLCKARFHARNGEWTGGLADWGRNRVTGRRHIMRTVTAVACEENMYLHNHPEHEYPN